MLDNPTSPIAVEGNDVESVGVGRAPVTPAPVLGHTCQNALFADSDGRGRPTERTTLPRLDFDEGDEPVPARDQVKIVPPSAKPMMLDLVAARRQKTRRFELSLQASTLTRVLPLVGGSKSAGHTSR